MGEEELCEVTALRQDKPGSRARREELLQGFMWNRQNLHLGLCDPKGFPLHWMPLCDEDTGIIRSQESGILLPYQAPE